MDNEGNVCLSLMDGQGMFSGLFINPLLFWTNESHCTFLPTSRNVYYGPVPFDQGENRLSLEY